ncbi:hypothetical protein AMTR_s00003p00152430 [Amborella trichopoda]|uniref:S-protein homolog n=1 Tax=Amborella trichopoda TaxID=13333 RepID=W1P5M6_AMBTC|nr:hypothetical protein AMTR_s00003p00152430 [Amborella trichopoda]
MDHLVARYKLMVITIFILCSINHIVAKIEIQITNRLGGERSLNLHCQSKDDDLGKQTLKEGNSFRFEFSPNFFGGTLFYCDMEWERVSKFSFDAYSEERDVDQCRSKCMWLVAEEGIYRWSDRNGFWAFMFFWPS